MNNQPRINGCPSRRANPQRRGLLKTVWAARLLLLLLLALLPATGLAQFNYTTSNGAATITGYTGPGGAVVIPGTLGGYPVTTIGQDAFDNITGITSITIPNSVTTIGESAFQNCSGLTSITIPNSVTSIGAVAFAHCYGLASITIPNSVTTITYYAFSDCTSLASITIPNSVTTIGEGAFQNCSGLTSITIPNSVITIGAQAFYYCTSLASITIPNSVTTIGLDPFSGCTSLTSITVNPGNPVYSSVAGVLYNQSQTILIECPQGKSGSYTIPNSVTSIGEDAFSECTSLASITIPNSVTTITVYAFSDCTSLTSITIPNSVITIGALAFYDCTFLTAYFQGNAPSTDGNVFEDYYYDEHVTVYYLPCTTGWSSTFAGVPAVEQANNPLISALPATLPGATQAYPFSQMLTGAGGTAPYTFAVTGGSLPPGLTLSSGGVLSGTPSSAGNYNFTVTTTSTGGCAGSQAYSVTVGCFLLSSFFYGAAPVVGSSDDQTITASGGTAPYTFAVTGGSLPPGLALSSGGVLSGTPTSAGNYNFTVMATDMVGCTASQSYSIMVSGSGSAIRPGSLPVGMQGAPYSQPFTPSGGTAPYTFAVTAGSLPPGLTLSSAGVLSGTPTGSGGYYFTVTSTSSDNFTGSQNYYQYVAPFGQPVPTLSQWGMIILASLLPLVGALFISRRQNPCQ